MKKWKRITVAVSGGFDPLHIGHIRLFEAARKLGDRLVVILNNDNWIEKKKGRAFMPEKERKEIIEALKFVDEVNITKHSKNPSDMSIVRDLERLKPDIFANGGDRKFDNIPEVGLCERLGIDMKFGIGRGGKVQSSSWLINKSKKLSK